jgi:hypothetical protein
MSKKIMVKKKHLVVLFGQMKNKSFLTQTH